MDPTSQFFTKLRKLAAIVESETDTLQRAFENRRDEDDTENQARAMRGYHKLNCDVGNLKEQIQEQLTQQKTQMKEVTSFITSSTLMQMQITEDIQALRRHFENYGYTAPQRPNETKSQDPEAEVADEDETKSAGEEEGNQEEAGGHCSPSPPTLGSSPVVDGLRTPQLSDFGLSEIHLKRVLVGPYSCSEVPPMPAMNFPHPSLSTPELPPMPITPKCALRMDDDELQTPQMRDFGISENPMCLNNDFTMNLFQKNTEKPQRQSQDVSEPPATSQMESLQSNDAVESPEPPAFCTPGFKLKTTNSQSSPNLPTTPEVPAFQTPYLNRLASAKESARHTEPILIQADGATSTQDGDRSTFELLSPSHKGATASKRAWAYDVPELSIMGVDNCQDPEMPNLESVLGNIFQSKNMKILKNTKCEKVPKDSSVNCLELDGPTQEFSLGTPRIRMDYQEPGTPEMPDLSSVTQDICKLVSKAQLKNASLADVYSHVGLEKETNSVMHLSVVSESEFQSLPSYLKQMTLHNLNQAVHSINKFSEEHPGQIAELQMEQLKRITNVGTKTPVYILCLTELKRLKRVGGPSNTSLYKLCP